MIEALSRLNHFDRTRLALIDRINIPQSGRFAFAPQPANISLTRRCESLCLHCAPNSQPHSTESLTRQQVDRFIEGLHALPIGSFYVGGGEALLFPEMVYHTFSKALDLSSVMTYVLERLAGLGFEKRGREFIIAGNIDGLHARFSPLENNLRLIRSFYDYFPNEAIVEEESNGAIPRYDSFQPAPSLTSARNQLERLVNDDWTGIENNYIVSVVTIACELAPQEIMEVLRQLKEKNETAKIALSLMKYIADQKTNTQIITTIVNDSEMLDYFASSSKLCGDLQTRDKIKKLLRAIVLGDISEIECVVEKLEYEKINDAVFLVIDNLLAVHLRDLVGTFVKSISIGVFSRLIRGVNAADHYEDKITTRDLLGFRAINYDIIESNEE